MRKKKEVTILDENRDKGKTFVLTEMPALQAERWATRAFLALTKAGIDIPPDIINQGIVGISILGIKALAGMHTEEAYWLMDEMFTCVAYRPAPDNALYVRVPIGDDIEEVSTRLLLRREILELHTGFSFADVKSTLTSASAE